MSERRGSASPLTITKSGILPGVEGKACRERRCTDDYDAAHLLLSILPLRLPLSIFNVATESEFVGDLDSWNSKVQRVIHGNARAKSSDESCLDMDFCHCGEVSLNLR